VCEPVIYGSGPSGVCPRRLSAEAGRAAYDAICHAVRDAQSGRVAAIATAPVNKLAFARAALPWKGHTDLLGHLTGSERVAMMFWSEQLKVVLATVHVPLADVPRMMTVDLLTGVIELTARELPRFGVASPRLALAGLNPHAGEDGLLGDEEGRVLKPAVEGMRARGVDISGHILATPCSSARHAVEFDAVIACYHDQGLIPVKLLAFGESVNVTLGLPIIRTSVDHGTAFDIAGKGMADPSSMIAATLLAARLAAQTQTTKDTKL
jgi:4-hydroxythreonine-4-phosphate dehydrogenase